MADRTVFMFPGQGSQSVGMRKILGGLTLQQTALFEQANDLLGFHLSRLIDEGPEEELTRTSNTQPALLTMACACALGLNNRGWQADMVMGHSVGEYGALAHAGVLHFSDALQLVRTRGLLMEKAVSSTPGKMAAVIGSNPDRLAEVVAAHGKLGVLEITNYNSPTQVVLSGEAQAVEKAVETLNSNKLGRAMILNVSAPFHSSLMKPIAAQFKKHLNQIDFKKPRLIFIDNVTGSPETDPERIREKLIEQVTSPVMWEKSVRTASGLGATSFIECGPGSVLSGLVKRTLDNAQAATFEKLLSLPGKTIPPR